MDAGLDMWSEGVKMVQKFCTPHNTNAFALKFAEVVLETLNMVDNLIRHFTEGREYLVSCLD